METISLEQVSNGFVITFGPDDAIVTQVAVDLPTAIALITAIFTPETTSETTS